MEFYRRVVAAKALYLPRKNSFRVSFALWTRIL
jgi:hypothetical protein